MQEWHTDRASQLGAPRGARPRGSTLGKNNAPTFPQVSSGQRSDELQDYLYSLKIKNLRQLTFWSLKCPTFWA
jgi:hypothetical protein